MSISHKYQTLSLVAKFQDLIIPDYYGWLTPRVRNGYPRAAQQQGFLNIEILQLTGDNDT